MKFKTKHSKRAQTDQTGFTIIELMIATVVFSVVLVIFLSALIQISQLFYKGVNLSNTQEAARNVLQDISDDIQFSGGSAQVNVIDQTHGYVCVGNNRYAYHLGYQYQPGAFTSGSDNYGIAKEGVGCASLTALPVASTYQELLNPGMQLNALDIQCANGLCKVHIHVVYYNGDTSVLYSPSGKTPAYQADDALCNGPAASTQFCATADYTGEVLQTF